MTKNQKTAGLIGAAAGVILATALLTAWLVRPAAMTREQAKEQALEAWAGYDDAIAERAAIAASEWEAGQADRDAERAAWDAARAEQEKKQAEEMARHDAKIKEYQKASRERFAASIARINAKNLAEFRSLDSKQLEVLKAKSPEVFAELAAMDKASRSNAPKPR